MHNQVFHLCLKESTFVLDMYIYELCFKESTLFRSVQKNEILVQISLFECTFVLDMFKRMNFSLDMFKRMNFCFRYV
jgi:hypothetical protein